MLRQVRKLGPAVAIIIASTIAATSSFATTADATGSWQANNRDSQEDNSHRNAEHSHSSSHGDGRINSSYQSGCTAGAGLAYDTNPQGLHYGHGLQQMACPTSKPSQHKPRQVTVHKLIVEASTRLAPPSPLVKTAPPRGKRELVGVPTWFWLVMSQWGSRRSSASAGGVSVSIAASAYELVIDPGDGSDPLVCRRPWTPYSGNPSVTSSCTHAYSHSGRYTVGVAVKWAADWSASGGVGGGGTLPTITRRASFRVTVVQARSELIANP